MLAPFMEEAPLLNVQDPAEETGGLETPRREEIPQVYSANEQGSPIGRPIRPGTGSKPTDQNPISTQA
jgi:hypothetical protein